MISGIPVSVFSVPSVVMQPHPEKDEPINARSRLKRICTLHVTGLQDWLLGATSAVAAAAGDRDPDRELTLGADWKTPHAMIVRDLDGDGVDEAVVVRTLPPLVEDGPRRLHALVVKF